MCTTKLEGEEKGISHDARFCFRVISPTKKKGGVVDTLVLQAESYGERADWMKGMQV